MERWTRRPLRRWPTALGLLLVTPSLLFVAANVANLLVAGLGLALLGSIGLYLIAENLI